MPRYSLTIEYDGTRFVGWQVQPSGPSVQGALVTAIERLSAETVSVKGAGRTDAGVHATGQVAHFNLARSFSPDKIREGLNHHLKPDPIVVLDCREVDLDFDARFSAVRRHYRYRILNRRAPPALERTRVWWVPFPMDAEAMARSARALVGRHDFTTFRAAQCQASSPLRTLDHLTVTRFGDIIEVSATARSFLHHQVRSMVGSMKLVGTGRWPEARLGEILAARDRTLCGMVAPAAGLYLVGVDY